MVHRSYKRRTPNKASTLVLHKKSRVKDEAFGKSIFFSKDGRKIHLFFFLVGNWFGCHCAFQGFQDTARSTPSENHQTRPYHLQPTSSTPLLSTPTNPTPLLSTNQIFNHKSTPINPTFQSFTIDHPTPELSTPTLLTLLQ